MIRFALLLLAASLSFAADPFIGTWKPDTAKWKLSAGAPERRKSELLTFESGGKDGYRVIIQNKASSVPPQERFFDGKEHKTEDGFTEKFERIDERHLKITASSSK